MSIELKQAAQQALVVLGSATSFMSRKARDQHESVVAELRAAIQQAEAQQPSSKEHLFELWWEAHMPNATQEQAWTAFTAAVASNGVGIAAQQPATPEPVVSRNPFASRCYTMSESHLSGHRLIVGFEKLGDVQDAHEWVARQARGDFTHPAPSVPADVVRDAERYRWLRDNWFTMGASYPEDTVKFHLGNARWSEQPESNLDAAIDAAMLAAKDTK